MTRIPLWQHITLIRPEFGGKYNGLNPSASDLQPNPRYLVPDLSPADRPALQRTRIDRVFVAESPHTSEIAPADRAERRPLCGAAGKKWWNSLRIAAGGLPDEDVSLKAMLEFCGTHRVAVMNAVQYPLDQGIAKKVPEAEPLSHLGFSKNAGPHSYKKLKAGPEVAWALGDLRKRLRDPKVAHAPIHCLGNDAEWFVRRALGPEEWSARKGEKIPHPSAWWRRGGYYGRLAQEILNRLFRAS